jgi:hypothetical protein
VIPALEIIFLILIRKLSVEEFKLMLIYRSGDPRCKLLFPEALKRITVNGS